MTSAFDEAGFSRWRVPRELCHPWWRCSDPERPTDPYVRWHDAIGDDCAGCRFGAALLPRQYPDDSHVAWLADRLGAR